MTKRTLPVFWRGAFVIVGKTAARKIEKCENGKKRLPNQQKAQENDVKLPKRTTYGGFCMCNVR